jgi:hypothetical protein
MCVTVFASGLRETYILPIDELIQRVLRDEYRHHDRLSRTRGHLQRHA